MGPKKKPTKQGEEEDLSTKQLLSYYKKFCKELEILPSKELVKSLNEKVAEDLHMPEMLINEKIGEFGAKALADALKKTKYYKFN
jgi:hypothetical protein